MPRKTQKKIDTEMTADQYAIFLRYWGMGIGRSLSALRELLMQDQGKTGVKIHSVTTYEDWSRKFKWQQQLEKHDKEANDRLFAEAMGAAYHSRVEINKIFKAVVTRYAEQIKNNPKREITAQDVMLFWKMANEEMGTVPGALPPGKAEGVEAEVLEGFKIEIVKANKVRDVEDDTSN